MTAESRHRSEPVACPNCRVISGIAGPMSAAQCHLWKTHHIARSSRLPQPLRTNGVQPSGVCNMWLWRCCWRLR